MHRVAFENLRPSLSETCPEAIRNLIKECTLGDPSARPSIEDVVKVLETLIFESVPDPILGNQKYQSEEALVVSHENNE